MANLIGQPAANMEMVDTLDKSFALYNVKSDMVVVCFWDPHLQPLQGSGA